jgi:uncharacterized protein YndB with AHSA1/START domain
MAASGRPFSFVSDERAWYRHFMQPITVSTRLSVPVDHVWQCFTEPDHIAAWNRASDDWQCPTAENDLRVGGRFSFRMEAKDGSDGFDFSGSYTEVIPHERIGYTMDDGRRVLVAFIEEGGSTTVAVAFEPEAENPIETQRAGWQAIIENFKSHTEREMHIG